MRHGVIIARNRVRSGGPEYGPVSSLHGEALHAGEALAELD